MTKEQILSAACKEYGTLYEDNKSYARLIDGDVQAVYDAMDQYSKQQAISFFEYIVDNHLNDEGRILISLFTNGDKKIWFNHEEIEFQDVYNQFIKSK